MQTPSKLRKTLKLITNEPHKYHPPCKFLKPECNAEMCYRAATVDFWQARMPQQRPLHRRAAATDAVFYFSKSSQGPCLGGPVLRVYPKIVKCTVPSQVDQWDSGANLRDQSA